MRAPRSPNRKRNAKLKTCGPPRAARGLAFSKIVANYGPPKAEVEKLAEAPDLGSGGAILRGSSPLLGKYLIVRELLEWPFEIFLSP